MTAIVSLACDCDLPDLGTSVKEQVEKAKKEADSFSWAELLRSATQAKN
jgi:hypothetical protein